MALPLINKEEIYEELMLTSRAGADEIYTLVESALKSQLKLLMLSPNLYLKKIIAGWRRGYSCAAVADHLIADTWPYSTSVKLTDDQRAIRDELTEHMNKACGYGLRNWGDQYLYNPSLEEMNMDPLEVQVTINDTARERAKLYGSEPILFGDYNNNAGAVRSKEELEDLSEFRTAVVAALKTRYIQFFGDDA